MRILVHHQGQQLGPFTVEQLRAALVAGTVAAQDLAWWEGQATWSPVATVPGLGVVVAPGGAPVVAASGDGSALALWSLILGILALFLCSFFSGIPAVICGHMALGRKARAGVQAGRGLAIGGLVTGYFSFVIGIIAILVAIAIPVFSEAQSKAKITQSMAKERMIIATLEEYAVAHDGKYPATLEEMVGKELPSADSLTDPLAPEFGGDGYIYFRPDRNDPPDKAVVVSRGQATHGRRAVAFHDGSVRSMPYSVPVDL